MKIIIMGPQGSGKGTQAEMIEKKYNIPHISTGDIFRQAFEEKIELGLKAQEYWGMGNLVPDDITTGIVKERLKKQDCRNGFILDGFPRTVVQAEALDKITRLDKVIELDITDSEAILRISGRRICTRCQAVYNVQFKQPLQENVCDKCKGHLIQRDDDKPEKIKKRLEIYHEQTKPILEHYRQKGILRTIDARKGIDEVFREIVENLG
jgi:adenylate kinase